MSAPQAVPNPSLSLGGVLGRRATWMSPVRATDFPPPAAYPRSSSPPPQNFDDPALLELRRASIAHLERKAGLRSRASVAPTSSDPFLSGGLPPPRSLVAELAKFDQGTPYEELRFVMDLTTAQPFASTEGIYPISSAMSDADASFAPSESEFSFALDAMDPRLSPAARRYLNEYTSGQHRVPVFSNQTFAPPVPSVLPQEPLLPPPSIPQAQYGYYPPHVPGGFPQWEPISEPAPTFYPFPPQAFHNSPYSSYFPGPATPPVPPPTIPQFDIRIDPSPSTSTISQFASPDLLSPNFSASSPSSTSSASSPSNSFLWTPSTTPSTSPYPCTFPFFPPNQNQNGPNNSKEEPLSFSLTETLLSPPLPPLLRRKKKSLARLTAEEYARTRGAVKSWGIVKFFDGNKGWGFILDQSRVPGEDVWTHYTNLEIPRGHRFLVSEEVVEYLIVWDTKKSQLKALLVTGLGGTPLLAFSDPTLAASLSKFKPSQGPLPPTLSPKSKQKIYALKRQRYENTHGEGGESRERMKRYLEREDEEEERQGEEAYEEEGGEEEEEGEEERLEVERGLLDFGTIGLGLTGIEELDEEETKEGGSEIGEGAESQAKEKEGEEDEMDEGERA
ncbi:hypothetical protein JCM16303_004488 [Sporobolomyces ruberrimus]